MRIQSLRAGLHWVLAVLITAALGIGFFGVGEPTHTDPEQIALLRLHMAGGMLIAALTVLRVALRLRAARAACPRPDPRLVDRVARALPVGLDGLILLLVSTGFATARLAGLPAIVFGGSGEPLPTSYAGYPTGTAHEWCAALLVLAIALHVLAAVRKLLPTRPLA